MFVNSGGAWKVPKQISVKDQGAWKRVETYYAKVSGTWKIFNAVPSNVVLLYNQMPSTGYICDGSNGTPNLINKALAALDTPLQVGGNDTHYGSDHGTITIGFSYFNATWRSLTNAVYQSHYPYVPYELNTSLFYHTHDSIGLGSGGTCDLRLPGKKLIPVIGQYNIEPNCIFLRIGSISIGYLLYLSDLVGKYLYLANAAGDVSYTNSVTHVSTGITTSHFTANIVADRSAPFIPNMPIEHWHTASVDVTHNSPTPATKTYIPYQTTAYLNWNDVPSGTIIFVIDNNLPSGYSWISFSSAALLKADSTSGSIVGSAVHSHGASVSNQSTSTGNNVLPQLDSGAQNDYMSQSHSIYDHNVSSSMGSANTMPAYVTLRLAVKN
jgi:hypothetical protein